MPRLVKYAFSRSSTAGECVVGPPCTKTTYGGSSPAGATASGERGGYTYAWTSRSPGPGTVTARGSGRYAGSGGSASDVRSGVDVPAATSTRTTAGAAAGPAATPAARLPATESSGCQEVYGRDRSVSSPVAGS